MTLLSLLQLNFNIISLTETWNPMDNRNNFNPGKIIGYNDFTGTSGHTLNSGCGLYVKTILLTDQN